MSRPMADAPPKRPRRQFTDEFKASAVRLVLDEGKTVGAAARDLDLTETALREWVKTGPRRSHPRPHRSDDHGAGGIDAAAQENRILQEEREILKKWSCVRPHPRQDESGSVCTASEPGQGRRLLVLRARKTMDPSAAPQAPRTVARLPSGIAEHAR
jgi:transposase